MRFTAVASKLLLYSLYYDGALSKEEQKVATAPRSVATHTFFSNMYKRQRRRRRRPLGDYFSEGKVSRDPGNDALAWTFHLHPTAILEVDKERRRILDDESSNDTVTSNDHPEHWFAREQNAVYATIPDRDDPLHANNRQLHEYHTHRHLSRYERQYRYESGMDLQLDWNGAYDSHFFALFEDEYIAEKEAINNTSNTSALQRNNNATATRRRTSKTFGGPKVTAGGQFNNYQAVPLSQGYGTHFSNLWIGTPTPQRKTVIVDTGSHYTAFPCTGTFACSSVRVGCCSRNFYSY